MSSTDKAIIRSLVDCGIIRDTTLEKTVLDYIKMVKNDITNFDDHQKGVVCACAWLAVEHLGYFPSGLLREIQTSSILKPSKFIALLVQVRQILLDRPAKDVTVKAANTPTGDDAAYTVPRVYDTACTSCVKHGTPCIQVLASSLCLPCFSKKLSHCDKSDCDEPEAAFTPQVGNIQPPHVPRTVQTQGGLRRSLAGTASVMDTSNGERRYTAKKPRIDIPPSEVDTSLSSHDEEEDQDYTPRLRKAPAKRGPKPFDETRSKVMKAVWAERFRLAEERGVDFSEIPVKGMVRKGFREAGVNNTNRRSYQPRSRGGRGGRDGRRGPGRPPGKGKAKSSSRADRSESPPLQLARKSTTTSMLRNDFVIGPRLVSENAEAGSSTLHNQGIQDPADGRLPSPPTSEDHRRSASMLPALEAPPFHPAGVAGPSGSQPLATTMPASDSTFLRADIRRLAESIVSLNEAHPCNHKQLYLPIRGLKRRLDDHARLTLMAAAEPREALESELEVLEDEMLAKEREIVSFFRENEMLEPHSEFAARLRHMIWDLEDRLDML